jgi:cytochrome c oxidase subunit IV
LEKNYAANNWWDRIFVHAPFSLWHGFVVFVAVLNTFAAFTSTQEDGPDTLHITLVIFGLVFLTSTAIGYVEYKGAKGDVTGALVIAIGLFGVFAQVRAIALHVFFIHFVPS